MKQAVMAFLAGLGIGILGSTTIVTIAATTQLAEVEAQYEIALAGADSAYDTLYGLYRNLQAGDAERYELIEFTDRGGNPASKMVPDPNGEWVKYRGGE